MNTQTTTFLKVFIELENKESTSKPETDFLAPDNKNSTLRIRSRSSNVTSGVPSPTFAASQSAASERGAVMVTSQYTTIPIAPNTNAARVCQDVARKRNLIYTQNQYELVMCDGDGQESFDRILSPNDVPWQFQQSAAKHGHLGDFHFKFRHVQESDTDSDSSGAFFPKHYSTQTSQGESAPAGFMYKRGGTNKSWRRRYFVLLDDELCYYASEQAYAAKKEPRGRIELRAPPAIVRVLRPEAETAQHQLWYYLALATPRRTFSLKVPDYHELVFWARALTRINTSNRLLDALDHLIEDSELLHAECDEQNLQQFSSVDEILKDHAATDAYMKFLRASHNETFILFWLDLQKYLSDYYTARAATRQKFARELFNKYIDSKAKNQLSGIDSRLRNQIRSEIETGVSRELFDDVQDMVHGYFKREACKFFNSNEYYRFIVTYNNPLSNETKQLRDKRAWPSDFERTLNKEQDEDEKRDAFYGPYLANKGGVSRSGPPCHSPVLNSPNSLVAASWTGKSAFSNTGNAAAAKKKRNAYGKSVFENAPGRSKSKDRKLAKSVRVKKTKSKSTFF